MIAAKYQGEFASSNYLFDCAAVSDRSATLSATSDMTISPKVYYPPKLRLKPPLPLPDWVGKNGFNSPASAAKLRVWINNSPGPVNSATIPSPLIMLRKRPAAAFRKVYCVVPSQATRCPVSTT